MSEATSCELQKIRSLTAHVDPEGGAPIVFPIGPTATACRLDEAALPLLRFLPERRDLLAVLVPAVTPGEVSEPVLGF